MLRYVIAVVLLAAVCQAAVNTTTVVGVNPTPVTNVSSTTTTPAHITTDAPQPGTTTKSGAPSVFAPTFFLLAISTVFAAVLRV